jgi:hypothetical protein
LKSLDVGTGGEMGLAGYDNGSYRWIDATLECFPEFQSHVLGQGINRRTIESDQGNGALNSDFDEFHQPRLDVDQKRSMQSSK